MRTKDWILWQPVNGIWRPDNVENIWSRGVETKAKYGYDFNKIKWEMTMQYQMTYSTDKSGHQLLFTPRHSASAGVNFKYKTWYFTYNQNYSGRRFMSTDNETWTNPFTLGNIMMGGTTVLGRFNGDYSLRINNIFNADYQPIRFYAMPRRNFMAQFALSF